MAAFTHISDLKKKKSDVSLPSSVFYNYSLANDPANIDVNVTLWGI